MVDVVGELRPHAMEQQIRIEVHVAIGQSRDRGVAAPQCGRVAQVTSCGQRIFLLHDGRTTDLLEAIRAHRSAGNARFHASEANVVIDRYNALNERDKQDLLNVLRSL